MILLDLLFDRNIALDRYGEVQRTTVVQGGVLQKEDAPSEETVSRVTVCPSVGVLVRSIATFS